MEWYPDRSVRKLGYTLPFGCHNWQRFSADFYVEIFRQLGYNLRPFRSQMGNDDYEIHMSNTLRKFAINRLIHKVERGNSVLQYLPTKRFASIRVIKSPKAMGILAGLILEENSIADKIFIYDEKNFRDLVYDVKRENLPHLVLVTDDDKLLIQAIENKGLFYGRHFISFQREYIKIQEKLFHNLGK